MPQRKDPIKLQSMTLDAWQKEVYRRTQGMQAKRRFQPLALLNRHVIANDEPWQALCSRAIPFAAACFEEIRRGSGQLNATTRTRLLKMVKWIDSRADEWKGDAAKQYRELRRLIGEVAPEMLPARDEMDRQRQLAGDPFATA